jgi:hypothetical protein
MTDTPEAVASALHAFIEAVGRRAAGVAHGQTQVYPGPGAVPTLMPEPPVLTACRECVTKLTDDDRAKLREIIQKMYPP